MSKPRTGAPKRVAVGLLAGALMMFGVALAPPAGAVASVTTSRLAGTTRYGTAQAIAASSTFSAPTTAIVATGENFPDALAASTLAGANAQAPIILTQTGTYTAEAKAALAALKTKGVSAVTVVGGTSAVAQSVEDAIKADGFTVTRVAGDDRYETAAAIATAANTKSASAPVGSPSLKTAFIATGTNYPDALAGGPGAYANKLPLLLVNDTVPAETSNAISTLGIKKVVILGGTAAVSATVEAALVTATGNPATRLAGVNRYGTATAVADYEKATLAFPVTGAVLATGVNFPDALAAGPLGGQNKAPIVLTASLPAESQKWLDDNSATLSTLFVSGGTSAIDDATVAAAKTAAQNTANDSANKAVTTRPELVGASVVETVLPNQVTATKQAGTYVRYTFDEALGTGFGANFGFFHVYSSGATQYSGGAAGTGSTFEAGTPVTAGSTTVLVNYPAVSTAALAADLTVATVEFAAVRDVGGAENPEGSAPIGTVGTTTSAAGVTAAPDLVSVGNFRASSTSTTTAVDFTFDQAAFVASSTGFHLVDVSNNTPTTCESSTATTDLGGGTTPGGSGTTVITVRCPNISSTTVLWSAATVARGYIEQGAVATAAGGTGVINPVQAADVAGNTVAPDLVSVAATPGGTTGDLANRTVAIFTFDTQLNAATSAAFHLYSANGSVANSTGVVCVTGDTATDTGTRRCVINSADARQVRVIIDGNLTSVVGGYVDGLVAANGATNTLGAGGSQSPAVRSVGNISNQVDEEGATGASSSTRTPGKTSAPDLLSVTLSSSTDAFGNANAYKATYAFDSAATTLTLPSGFSGFRLYFSDGTRWNATGCAAGDGLTTGPIGTVTCTTYSNNVGGAAPVGTALSASVLGTVAAGSVSNGLSNPEGAAVTTGGTGTAAS